MTEPESFVTTVGVSGVWPEMPSLWSFSALEEVALCPRRYALRRASYPDLWDGQGYPERVSEAALVGSAVHEGVELVLRELNRAGCASLAGAQAVAVIRGLGGFTEIAEGRIRNSLAKLALNPRMAPRLESIRQRLDRRCADMRRAIQSLVSQSSVTPVKPGPEGVQSVDRAARAQLREGAHPEAGLIARAERFAGRIDLLVVHADHAVVIDFKTGQASDRHERQLHLYGLLWQLDDAANPDRLPVRSLVLGYVDGPKEVAVPTDWEALREGLREEIAIADSLVCQRWPPAVPSINCWHCPVRHMCDEYWESDFVVRDSGLAFTDAAVRITSRNGPTSWVGTLSSGRSAVLLRTRTEDADLPLGCDVRILDLLAGEGEDFEGLILTFTRSSEVFGPVTQTDRSPTHRPVKGL